MASTRNRSRKPKPGKAATKQAAKPQPSAAVSKSVGRQLLMRRVVVGGMALLLVGAGFARLASRSPAAAPSGSDDLTQTSNSASPAASSSTPLRQRVQVHARHAHDPRAFTQGLVWDRGQLFESTGLVGRSSVREVDWDSGAVKRAVPDERSVFGEGLALVDGELFQLTWRDERALVWDARSLQLLREIPYHGEGWGLCYDGRRLVMSDGSSTLFFRNKSTFAVEGSVSVTRDGQPQTYLNELECVDGKVYANVWQSDEIVRIDPASGVIDRVIDAHALLADRQGTDVLNGIAFVPETGRFLVTGKLWPTLFEVTFEAAP